jgi:transposase
MELITILNRCHRFRGFIYQHACFGPDHKSIEIAVRPRKGSAAVCSGCHHPAPGYDQLPERRHEFIPLWGISGLPDVRDAAGRLSPLSRRGRRASSLGQRQASIDQRLHAFFARWARWLSWKETAEAFHTSWDKVCDGVEYVVTFGLEHRTGTST